MDGIPFVQSYNLLYPFRAATKPLVCLQIILSSSVSVCDYEFLHHNELRVGCVCLRGESDHANI